MNTCVNQRDQVLHASTLCTDGGQPIETDIQLSTGMFNESLAGFSATPQKAQHRDMQEHFPDYGVEYCAAGQPDQQ